jgi:hypothetical protein
MIKLYFTSSCKVLLLAALVSMSTFSVFAAGGSKADGDTTKTKNPKPKITDTRKDKPAFLSSGVKVNVVPFKPAAPYLNPGTTVSGTKTPPVVQDSRSVSNLKIYPNPIENEVNFSYHLTKESNVSIKIMDILGNEVVTLLSQKLQAGDQVNTFNLSSKITSGIYFVRITVGNEPIVKRISIL